jgi:hypothetical protein
VTTVGHAAEQQDRVAGGHPAGLRPIGISGQGFEVVEGVGDLERDDAAVSAQAGQGGLAMADAFAVLRRYARRNNRRVTDCARAVVADRPTGGSAGRVDETGRGAAPPG